MNKNPVSMALVEPFALTLTQKDIYFDQLKHPNNPLYNVGGYIRIGEVDVPRLQKAHKMVVETEAAFGIRIVTGSQGVEQYISSERNAALDIVDFSTEADAQSSAGVWLNNLFETALNIDDQPLFKAALLKLSETAYWYVGFAHHLMMDGWGFANWAQRLGEIYNQDTMLFSQAQAQQSIDAWRTIALKDEQYLASKKYQSDKAYWLEQPLDVDRLLTRFYQRAGNGPTSSRALLPISHELFKTVGEFAKAHDVGISHVFMGLVASYFSAASGQSQLVFGQPAHNRRNHQQKQMLGVFTSISPITLNVGSEDNFIQLVEQIAKAQKSNFRHQRYPIGHMVKDLQRTGEGQDLYDICFNFLKLDSQLSFEGQAADLVYLSHNHEATPLMVTIWEYGEQGAQHHVEIQIDYHFDYFDKQEVELLCGRFEHHLSALLKSADKPLNTVALLPPQEQQLLLNGLNDNGLDYPKDKLIHQLFAEQAAKTPDNIALVFEDTERGAVELTYQELDKRSNQLASFIKERSTVEVDEDALVGVSMQRCENMVVAVLAILKAGKAYVPLDPKYPQSRLDNILQDSQMDMLLTDANLVSRFSDGNQQTQVLAPFEGELARDLPNYSCEPIDYAGQSPDQLAYAIYTSGSTGRPKGVAVRHRNTVAMLYWAKATFSEDELARVLACTSLNFDLSVFELFVPLSFGHQCVLVDNPLSLLELDCSVSLINTVPSAINTLMEENAIAAGVKVINLAGEALAAQTVNGLIEKGLCDRVCNLYGPSEDTTYSTCAQFNQTITGAPDIGRVIANSQAYVLSAEQKVLPMGVAGELYLAGDGVTRGYLKQPQLSAERYIDNPFGSGKLYRTGDLVRYLPQSEGLPGAMAFLGRIDEQVKIRGFRIELGDIEHHLRANETVAACVVVARENEAKVAQLVAYVVLQPDCGLNETQALSQLNAYLQPLLPEVMIPSAFVFLDEMPLSPNGKVAKNALPAPNQLNAQCQYVAPVNDTERQLVLIFAELLGLEAEKLSTTASFFTLGGHSLLTIRLMAQIREQMQCELSVSEVFTSPTVAALAKLVDASNNKIVRTAVTKIEHEAGELLPASFAQQRLWFIDQLNGSSAEYNMATAIDVDGEFDVAAAQAAFNRIIRRHESLRTVFHAGDRGTTFQQILADFEFTLRVHDLTELEETAAQTKIQSLIEQDSLKPFDLTKDLMVRAAYIACAAAPDGSQKGVLLLNMHHIASDGWSVELILREFAVQYRAVRDGIENPLPALEIQYVDYAQWQRLWLSGEVLQQQLNYWREQLDDAPGVHALPLEYPRPQVKDWQGGVVWQQLDAGITERLEKVAQGLQLTPFMLIHGALALVLSRHSNSDDIVIGTPVANRLQAELEPLIGFFVNTLALRTNTAIERLEDFAAHIRQVNIDAQSNQDIPFEQLVDHCKVPRSTQYTPIFQIAFSMSGSSKTRGSAAQSLIDLDNMAIDGLSFTQRQGSAVVAKFDLDIHARQTEQGIALSWTYDSSLFSQSRIERISKHLNVLLRAFAELDTSQLAGTRLSQLSMLPSDEQDHLFEQLNDAHFDYAKDKLVHQLFEAKAAEMPGSIAVVLGELDKTNPQQVTYRELNTAANQVAHYLRAQGVGSGDFVAMCFERSIDMVVAMLAIVKTGAAYVPLEAENPQTRLQFILEDTGCRHLLSVSKFAEKFAFDDELKVIALDDESLQQQLKSYPDSNLPVTDTQCPSSLAYVIYTSGTTGKPKGVLTPHLGVVSMVSNTNFMVLDEQTRFLDTSTIAFDAATLALWGPLLNGGCCILYAQDKMDLNWLNQTMLKFEVNTLWVTTGLFEQWSYSGAEIDSLNCILTGGQVIDPNSILRVKKAMPKATIVNAYGPTETTTFATCHVIPPSWEYNNTSPIAIGKPVQGTRLYVLSKQLQPVPLYGVGELYIGGDGLAQGYLNRPELSAESFIPHPFSDTPDARLYKTGDMVRYSRDNGQMVLQFVGRDDDQVKIRGFRIELAEVESQLQQCELVGACAVLVKDSSNGQKMLVAYVVPADEATAQQDEIVADIKRQLATRLPDFMMPSVFVVMAQLPLKSNGKTDKNALPSPQESLLQGEYVAPSTDVERQLTAIFADLLELPSDTLSATANFFELGGHSLLAISLVGAIKARFKVDITVKDVFEHSSVFTLAALLNNCDGVEDLPPMVALDRSKFEAGRGLVTSFAQQRLWLLSQIDGPSSHYNMSGALKLTGKLDINALNTAFTTLVERHESLRTVFKESAVDGEPMQVILPAAPVEVTVSDLSKLAEDELHPALQKLATEHAGYIFDLTADLMLQLHLVKLKTDEHALLFNTHHIASDGWSMGILINEFSALYRAIVAQTEIAIDSVLPQLPLQYADYAHWQRQTLRGEVLKRHLDYWCEQLVDLPQSHNLPLDRQRPALQSFNGATHISHFDKQLTDRLNDTCQTTHATLFMGLHAAFSVLLARYSNDSDIVIGTPVANREQREIAGLIGFFVNTLVLRSDLSAQPDFVTLLEQSKQMLLDAYQHQQLPFEQLVETLQPQRSLSHSPLFQVMLSLEEEGLDELQQSALDLPELTLSPLTVTEDVAKFDLTLTVRKNANGLHLEWEYNTDLFDGTTIAAMAGQFENLVDGLLDSTEQNVFAVPLLDETQKQQQLPQCLGERMAYFEDLCLHQLFEAQALKTPNAQAVVFIDEQGIEHSLCYAELNQKANQLARHLILQHQVKPETLVAIFMDRSAQMMVAVLAVLKAGGAYLPLDPEFPAKRLEFMLLDAQSHGETGKGLTTVLTQSHLVERLPDCVEHTIALDDAAQQSLLSQYDPNNVECAESGVKPANLAYVIYTSGSTGKPKGVMVEHRNIVMHMERQRRHQAFEADERFIMVSNIIFDASMEQYLLPLTFGATVVIPKEVKDIETVKQILTEQKITHLDATPGYLAVLNELPQGHSIKRIISGGDAMNKVLRQRFGKLLRNCYGPTETTITTLQHLTYNEGEPLNTIGKPLANSTAYVLNQSMQLVPEGVVGELHIGGLGVARGYLNQPELTQERFVANPFADAHSGEAGFERLYKTGDLVRRHANGTLEFIGRVDHQVKIRGYRIELGEIEHALGEHADIASSLVMVQKGHAGESMLVAYVVPTVADETFSDRLKQDLQQQLPQYMVPSAFVVMDEMPLTANGKIDKAALPSVEDSQLQREYVAPSTQTEKQLVVIWSQLLKLSDETLSITDNFFEWGGHSLLAVRLVADIAAQLNVKLTVKAIFEHPTIAALATAIDALSNDSAFSADSLKIEAVDREALGEQGLLLSYSQQRLWLLAQIDGNTANYNMPGAIKLSGKLNISALNGAFSALVERHESLRTVFVANTDNGEPMQVIRAATQIEVPQTDLSHYSGEDQQRYLAQMTTEHAVYPFDLSNDLMLQMQLIKLADDEHVLLFNMHHIASDGWSIGILINEFGALYRAICETPDRSPSVVLPPLAIQYADYAQWQRNTLKGEVLEAQLDYWTSQLAGLPLTHSLPLKGSRPPVQRFEGATHVSQLSSGLKTRLNDVCLNNDATLFMGLHAAFAVLLARYSNETDIVIGTPVANREQAEVAGLIGFFVNTLVLRSDLSAEDSNFVQILEQSKQMLLDAYDHQQLPFEQLVETLQPERNLSYSPLVQVMLVLQNNDEGSLSLPELNLTPLDSAAKVTNFDLTLTVSESDDNLSLEWRYNVDLFSASLIERMAEHFAHLLDGLLSSVQALDVQSVFEVPMLDESHWQQQLALWQDKAEYPQGKCIHHLFEAQAQQAPDAIAVVYKDQSISYGELERRANQLAHCLIEQYQVKPDTLVGICVERSIDMLVGILAILKAGGAYVPLDPNYPQSRIDYIVQDAEIDVVLTQQGVLNTVELNAGNTLCIDGDVALHYPTDKVQQTAQLTPSHLAYVIYTSGSTGQPKGVMVSHQNVIRLFTASDNDFSFGKDDVWSLFHSFSFDFSVWEIWGALLYGGRLVVVPQDVARSTDDFYQLVVDEQVTVLNQTPGAFNLFIEADRRLSQPQKPIALRYVVFGGEALNLAALEPWVEKYGDGAPMLINMYGITETTVHVTYRQITEQDIKQSGQISLIGRPLADLSVLVLSEALKPVPVGVAGELYVSGGGLARGYLNRADLTESRFIVDPLSDSQTRLYKTGDLVRWLEDADGKPTQLEYLGRIDHQVKIRGFRIELGEIEHHLQRHAEVDDVIVLSKQTEGLEPYLVAYVATSKAVVEGDASQANQSFIDELRQHLAEDLPAHMVPGIFVLLEQLPLTNNGKIDRKALPEVEQSLLQGEYVAAATETEKQLVVLWAELLKLPQDKLSITANFFEMGGHSLLAVRLVAAIAGELQVEIAVKDIFANPTIAALGKVLDSLDVDGSHQTIKPVARKAQGQVTSFAQQRLWLLHKIEGGSTHYNVPAALKLSGELNIDALNDAFTALVERHESLRTVFGTNPADGEPVQIIRPAVNISVPVTDLSNLSGEAQSVRSTDIAVAHATYGFDLCNDLMLQLKLLRLEDSEHVLLFNMHHIASDGWSMGILINEFCALYSAYVQGDANPLPALPIQYADYAQWQRDTLQGDVLEQHMQYWTEQLQDLPVLHKLPLDKPRPAVQSFDGATIDSVISAELSDKLNALCRQTGTTLFMALHSAFSILLARYSNETDIVVGTPVANRQQAEVAGLIGFFVNTLVLRSDLSDKDGVFPSFIELLEQSKQTLLDAYEHQQVPFEQVVETLQVERNLAHHALFQVMLVLQNNERGELSLPGLSVSEVDVADTTAMFDLKLNVSEQDDGLALQWQYNTELFLPSTITAMAAHFERLLEVLLSAPEQGIFAGNMLSNEEVKAQLDYPCFDYPHQACLHQIFEQRVGKTPEAAALLFIDEQGEQQQLSYAELNQKADDLALVINQRLAQQGRSDDPVVALYLERSPQMVIAILAVLKAGCAYAPIDIDFPLQRVQFIIEDSGAQLLLCDANVSQHKDMLPLPGNIPWLRLDEPLPSVDDAYTAVAMEAIHRQSSDLACVLYTSGTTGQPKGVLLTHQNIVNRVHWMEHQYPMAADERWMLKTPYTFDVSLGELFWPHLVGSALVIAPAQAHKNPVALDRLIRGFDVSRIHFVPSMLSVYCEYLANTEQTLPTSINFVECSGEALHPSHIEEFAAISPGYENGLVNFYGPTETGEVSWFNTTDYNGGPVPIGKAFGNSQLLVLNQQQQLVPMGSPGELYIGGAGVARGYLNRESLSAERFVQHPLAMADGRLYRTGDLARLLPEHHDHQGQLEYLGRIDQQVKIRGLRIEIGEIEHCLAEHDEVSSSLVMVSENESGEPLLVAYVIATADETDADWIAGIKQYMQSKLPAYMVPAAILVLDEWPLTNNGKIDKRALPQIDSVLVEGAFVAASTDTERHLVKLWSELLKLSEDKVSANANFFEIGGHSLLAVRLMALIESTLNIEISVKTIFEHSTVQSLGTLLDSMDSHSVRARIEPIDRNAVGEKGLVTSFAQQRLWLLSQIDGSTVHYNMPAALKLSGRVNMAALNQAFTALIERHETLRTVLAANPVDGEPMQVINPVTAIEVPVTDLSTLTDQAQTHRIAEIVQEHGSYLFDLTSDLMLQLRLLVVSESEHVLLFNMHHIASDGWSMGILINEFCALYEWFDQGLNTQGVAYPLPALPVQYADYAQWQRNTIEGEVLQGLMDYWRNQLADLPAQHSLPLDYPRPAVQTYNGAAHVSELPAAVNDKLNALCRDEGATLFMGLHAVFALLMARYSNETDIVIGTPVANREQAEIAGLIGFFINTLVLRSDLSADDNGQIRFVDLLKQSKQTLLDAYEHQQLPFEQLVEALQPQRSLSHSAMFQVMLVLQNNETGTLELPDLTMTHLDADNNLAKYDLTLTVSETEQGLSLNWQYNTDLFKPSSIATMASHFELLLVSALSKPEQSVFSLPMLTEAERHDQLVTWQGEQMPYSTDVCLHQLFERQALQSPDAKAVVYVDEQGDSQSLSYCELNEKANRLAHYLAEHKSIGPDTMVAICTDRSLEMVIGIMAILKAGAAYVPLSPDYPAARLAFLLGDIQSGNIQGLTVLTQSHLSELLPLEAGQAVAIDDESLLAELPNYPADSGPSPAGLTSQHLAYVIYTSGSTGQPKGVMVEHQQVVMHLERQKQHLSVDESDVFVMMANAIFDASIVQLFLPLVWGAAVVIPKEVKDTDLIKRTLVEHQVTHIHATPGYLTILDELPQGHCLKRVISGGDAMTKTLRERFGARLYNSYGPTEATVTCVQHLDYVEGEPLTTIGKPLANTQVFVLDGDLQLVPPGVVGELHIGGPGVTRGYFNQPKLTAERFIANPFGDANAGRLYKTGDLVRWRDNGTLEFVARIDNQVKVRGFRIELGEIEYQLQAQDAVEDALVLARPDSTGELQLVAYVVPDVEQYAQAKLQGVSDAELAAGLKKHLVLQLPDYMVPSAFVVLDQLPLTSNGKVDKKALPMPQLLDQSAQFVAPSSDTEKQLVSLWSELLQLPQDKISIETSFFDLGGHSLLSVRLANEIKALWPVDMAIKTIFANDTVTGLAELIDQEMKLAAAFGAEQTEQQEDEESWEF